MSGNASDKIKVDPLEGEDLKAAQIERMRKIKERALKSDPKSEETEED